MEHYIVIDYPDGQLNVEVLEFKQSFTFRIESYKDLFILKSIVDVYNYNKMPIIDITIPCLFGQRSDRRFKDNESFGLKIITDFINDLNIPFVYILDTHSDVSLALINNSNKLKANEFINKTIADINNKSIVLVSPDSGAYKRVFSLAEYLNLPLVAANKFRDLDGKITLNITGDVKDKECLILDDIADGAFTFYLLAKQLKELGASKVYLYVTHGYFNKGFELLKEYIDHIYCTDSVKTIENNNYVTQFKINI
jgi:ribose-phosphate pyrophosphokinase